MIVQIVVAVLLSLAGAPVWAADSDLPPHSERTAVLDCTIGVADVFTRLSDPPTADEITLFNEEWMKCSKLAHEWDLKTTQMGMEQSASIMVRILLEATTEISSLDSMSKSGMASILCRIYLAGIQLVGTYQSMKIARGTDGYFPAQVFLDINNPAIMKLKMDLFWFTTMLMKTSEGSGHQCNLVILHSLSCDQEINSFVGYMERWHTILSALGELRVAEYFEDIISGINDITEYYCAP